MGQYKKIKSSFDIGFRVHTPNLLQDIVVGMSESNNAGVVKIPLNVFQKLLGALAERAIEIDDPELNIICLSLGLYDTPPLEIPKTIDNQIKLMNKS